jgi:hypothetical protein
LYARYGDWFPWLCVLVSFVGVALGLRRRRPETGAAAVTEKRPAPGPVESRL